MELKLGMYVIAERKFSGEYCEGKIVAINESNGLTKALRYTIKSNPKETNLTDDGEYWGSEITPLTMPSKYECTAIDMLIRDSWRTDKRILRVAVCNPNFKFEKAKGRNNIKVSIDIYGKHFEQIYPLAEIKRLFSTWKLKDKPSYQYKKCPSLFEK